MVKIKSVIVNAWRSTCCIEIFPFILTAVITLSVIIRTYLPNIKPLVAVKGLQILNYSTYVKGKKKKLFFFFFFAFLAELVVDKAMELRFVGGVYGGNIKPTPFLCLTLKMLQIQPEKDIIVEFIKNEDFK